jgi:hypothetical protein
LRVEEERSNKKKFATIDASKNQLESLKKKGNVIESVE